MQSSPTLIVPSPSSNGPLRRNQACHQCRARKLKCDAGRPCSTCKRSHAKAIASLTSAGQAVLADPCCTYDYAPGEDPWTATLRGGPKYSPPFRSKSGSTSPGGLLDKSHVSTPELSTSAPLPSSMPQIGPLRTRRGTSTHKPSPPYTPPGKNSLLTPDSVYAGSPASEISRTTGAHRAFSSSLPSLTDTRGLPALIEPTGLLHAMPPYVHPQSFYPINDDLEYEEMAEMLYNSAGPLLDSPPSFTPLLPYTNPFLSGVSAGNGATLYAHDTLGSGFYRSNLMRMLNDGSDQVPLEPRLIDPTVGMPSILRGSVSTQDAGDLDFSFLASDLLDAYRHESPR